MITAEVVEQAVDKAAIRYDRDGDQHYDVISAFIKSVRGSDVQAALHYLARMVAAGEDPRFIARRLVILASEDIGLADPTALTTAVAAADAVQFIGMPEGRIILAQAVIALALAPKSNAVIRAIGAAIADVEAGRIGLVPAHLRDAHYAGAKTYGHGQGYQYAHDQPHGVAAQQYLPDELVGAEYYRPTDHGREAALAERLRRNQRAAGPDPEVQDSQLGGDLRPGSGIPIRESWSAESRHDPSCQGRPVGEPAGPGSPRYGRTRTGPPMPKTEGRPMTVGAIAGLIAAIAFVALVALAAVPLLKLGRVLEEVRLAVRDIGHESVPILTELQGTVAATNTELEKLSLVTEDVAKVSANATVVSENAAQMTSLFSATLGGPLVKTAAFSYGVRKALRGDGTRRRSRRGAHDPALLLVRARRRGGRLRLRQDPGLAAPGDAPRPSDSGWRPAQPESARPPATSPTGSELPWPSAKRSSATELGLPE